MLECIGLCQDTVRPTVIKVKDQSKRASRLSAGSFVANKLAQEAGIGSRLLLKHPVIVQSIRDVAWLMTRYNTGGSSASQTMAA